MKRVQGRPLPLGVSRREGGVNFAIEVGQGQRCELLLYKKGTHIPEEIIEMPEECAVGEIRYLALAGSKLSNYEYNYRIDGEIVVDPYARALAGREIWNEKRDIQKHEVRAKVLPARYDWEEDRPLGLPYEEVVAYSLHVRGFTKHPSSKVRRKGTFRGVTEKIPYLTSLGINQIQCMPVYEFEECQSRINYWGYGEAYYFAPKASYAAGKDAERELKDMIKECHRAGIEVVFDFPFSEHTNPQLIEECLRYYVMEYHVDGFILNPYNAPMKAVQSDALLKTTKIMTKDDTFQNTMRRFLKGDEGMVDSAAGQLRRLTKSDGKFNYIATHTGFTLADVVSYDGKHNEANGENNCDGPDYNYSWNCGAEGRTRKKYVMELRRKQMRNAMFLLLTAQGTPCILSGDEFGNSQDGNNNVYCQDNETGWVNWKNLERERPFVEYVKRLIAMRRRLAVLHQRELLTGVDRSGDGIPDVSYHGESAWQMPREVASRQLGVLYSGGRLKSEDCFVAYNMHWIAHRFALPALPKGRQWHQVVQTSRDVWEEAALEDGQRQITLEGRTAACFVSGESATDSRKGGANEKKTSGSGQMPREEKKEA